MDAIASRVIRSALALVVCTGCAPAAPQPTVTARRLPAIENQAGIPTTTLAAEPTPPPTPTDPVSATPKAPVGILWSCTACEPDHLWRLHGGEWTIITLPFSPGFIFHATAASDRLLFSSEFFDRDLKVLDLSSGSVETIVGVLSPGEVILAQWAPNGRDLAYLLEIAPRSYELHWRDPSGADRVIAGDVSTTWSISPSGSSIAFTRESEFMRAGEPGLYVVSVVDDREVRLSGADRSKSLSGWSFDDRPVWSLDGKFLLVNYLSGTLLETPFSVAWLDGGGVMEFSVDFADRVLRRFSWDSPVALWHPDGQHLVLELEQLEGMFGRGLVFYRLDWATQTLVDGVIVQEDARLIGWDVPGETLWVEKAWLDEAQQVQAEPTILRLP